MSLPSAPSVLELPRAIRDALAHLLLDELTSSDRAGSVESARRVLSGEVASDAGAERGAAVAGHARVVALRDALAVVGRSAAGGLRQDPDAHSVTARSVDDLVELRRSALERVQRYLAALAVAPRGDGPTTRLVQARTLLAQHLFFEVHELLEPWWRVASGDERRVLQGIIQAAVAWHHGTSGRRPAALRTASAAAAKLADVAGSWDGFPIAELRVQLEAYRLELEGGVGPAPSRLAL